ncbi:PQQ-dependent sugar dehydrogenase [Ramlibacter albus]|uniref:PQQ-dependent sugar dehydrogenase n=1 Tax=Ramlibacter albus TaxID=2079448 RepID=A0A923M8M1_9BURK|nr:PQQ-dependent sugar dehydrogenase [Ramlibacter albus]MBC5764876.1 PQQ-dependent sugar dehydrogenase [Ramlibacter albus]
MRFAAACLLLIAPAAWAAPCGPFQRLEAPARSGWCAGVVADAKQGLRMPRTVLWVGREAGTDHLLVADMGSWEPRRGRLLHVRIDGKTGQVRIAEVLRQLDRPHGLRRGPDRRFYIAEATRISRLEWHHDGTRGPLQPVVQDLPAEGRHPLKQIAFATDGTLYIGVGAASDDCADQRSVQGGLPACPEMTGDRPQAAVYKARIDFDAGRITELKVFALGLRNSTALAVHATGTVLQGENNIDSGSTERFPAEEINRLEEGGHYGWPGCVENRKTLPGFDAAACRATKAPVLTMPAHSAPLHMAYGSDGLVVGWHGYRTAGRRIVRYAVDARGLPRGNPVVLLGPWTLGPNRFGAPVAWAEDDQGQLWIADDRNRMLLRLGPER